MPTLQEVVQGIAARAGVDAVVVISSDGLPIHHSARAGFDADEISALTVTLVQSAQRLGIAVEGVELTSGVLEFGDRAAVFSALGGDNMLFVLAAPRTNIGTLLYDLRRHGPALTALL